MSLSALEAEVLAAETSRSHERQRSPRDDGRTAACSAFQRVALNQTDSKLQERQEEVRFGVGFEKQCAAMLFLLFFF